MNTETRSRIKKLTVGLATLLVLSGIVFGIREYLSYRTVTVVNNGEVASITIYNDSDREIMNVQEGEVRLKLGEYFYVPDDERFAGGRIDFTIQDDQELVVNPAYSGERLGSLLSEQRATIRNVLESTYPQQLESDYRIVEESLHLQGQWYTAKLARIPLRNELPDFYRVIVENRSGEWTIQAGPLLIIQAQDSTSIPEQVVDHVNQAPRPATYHSLER